MALTKAITEITSNIGKVRQIGQDLRALKLPVHKQTYMQTLQAALALAQDLERTSMPQLQNMSILELDNFSDMDVKKCLNETAKPFNTLKAYAGDLLQIYRNNAKSCISQTSNSGSPQLQYMTKHAEHQP